MEIRCAFCDELIVDDIPVEVVETIRFEGNRVWSMNYVNFKGETKKLECIIFDEAFYCMDCLKRGIFFHCHKCGCLCYEEEEHGIEVNLTTGEKRAYCGTCFDELE